MSDELLFADEAAAAGPTALPWQILVVDDDAEVHAVTKMALKYYVVEGRPISLIEAHSAAEARTRLAEYPDVALILLDVVMESEHAGLEFVRHVRDVAHNHTTRIVLRTGQPGQAPVHEVLNRYQIDDYRTKTELSFERLHVLVTTAIRTFRALSELSDANRELKRSNDELERFAYVASHDLQTPLRGIISFTQLLAQRYKNLFDDEAREYMQFIESGGRDLQQMIRDLLEYSRVGRSQGEHKPTDLNAVLKQVVAALAPGIASKGADVRVESLPKVHGNQVMLEQLFRNLIDNALKFQTQAKPWVRISAEAYGRHWHITVADGGIGIAAEHLEQIFNVFVRLHTQEEFPGSGVGLPICRKIARLHTGDLTVESTPGAGTRMIISLPMIEEG